MGYTAEGLPSSYQGYAEMSTPLLFAKCQFFDLKLLAPKSGGTALQPVETFQERQPELRVNRSSGPKC